MVRFWHPLSGRMIDLVAAAAAAVTRCCRCPMQRGMSCNVVEPLGRERGKMAKCRSVMCIVAEVEGGRMVNCHSMR